MWYIGCLCIRESKLNGVLSPTQYSPIQVSKMFDCPHGLGPLHLIVDIWWIFALPVVISYRYVISFSKKIIEKIKQKLSYLA